MLFIGHFERYRAKFLEPRQCKKPKEQKEMVVKLTEKEAKDFLEYMKNVGDNYHG